MFQEQDITMNTLNTMSMNTTFFREKYLEGEEMAKELGQTLQSDNIA